MSFGFGVGDFIAVGELCWKIYSRVYKVSRDAPEELRALIQELGNLSNTVNLLNEEVRDREDWIKRAGERRLEYTCKVMSQARETLEKMDRLANKYAELGTGDSSEGSKRSLRIKWNRIKYALEVSSINELRSKFMSYNFYLTLLLQGAQNSSLERIEKQQTKTDIKLEELRNVMISDCSSRESPLLKASLDEEVRAELSAAFLRSAEIGNRPWASIGIDDWLQAGQWWLLKARSQINHLAQGSGDKGHAYINLLKACWILTDIVSIHPQRTHLGASNDRRNDDIRNLSQIAKTSLESFPVFNFQLRDVENNTMKIWLQPPPSSTIAPRLQFSINRNTPTWQTSDGEILFQCFVEIKTSTEFIQDTLEECFLMLEVPQQGIYLNLILKNFAGQDIHKLEVEPCDGGDEAWPKLQHEIEKLGSEVRLSNAQDSEALIAILWGFQLFKSAFQPASLTVSMVHSVSVLANWPSRYPSCLPLPGYDLGFHGGSDSLSLLLRTIINDVVKEVYQDRRPSSLFFDRDCLDVKLPLDVFAWKIICWHCEKFAEAKSLLEEFNPHGHLRDSLVQTAFLRLDRDFLIQLVQYLNYEDGWHPHDVLFMVKAALSSDDVEYLSLVLEHVAASVLSEHQPAIFRLVSRRERLEHIDTMIQVIVARPTSIAVMLAFFLCSSDEQGFRDFLHIVDGRGGSFRGKTTDEVDFPHFYPTFVAGCARLIETQSPNILSLYLDTLEGLGIDFHTIGGCKNTKSTQLALLPALVSPYPAFLRILLEREVVVADMPPFFMERVRSQYMPSAREANSRMALVQYPHYSMLHWPLYCAVTLACDIEFVQLLCQHGAPLQQEIRGSRDHETKAPRIVCHLSRLSSLENARLAHIDSLVFCHILIHIGTKGNHYGSFQQGHFRAPEKIMEYKETWGCMERLLFRDSIFSSCSGACERAHNGSWKGNDRIRSELLSRYTEFPDRYPKQLRTQEDWDKWRRDALQILRK